MDNNRSDFCDCRVIHPSRIEKAKRKKLADHKVDRLAQLFKAIAEPGRIKILHALEHDEMCVCDLAAFLKVSESAVSHQLRTLRHLQLVANRREGAVLYYRVDKKIANKILNLGREHLREI